MSGDLNMNNNKIINLSEGVDANDAVNYSQLISHTTDRKRDYQLASSFKFYRDFGDKGALTKSRVQISGHLHLDLYDVGGIEGRDTGFNGEAWSSLKMTNTLERGIYTVVFETFSFRFDDPVSPSGDNILNDETLLYSVHGDAHFQIISFSHDWESNSGGNTPHSKAYIQFSSDGQPGEIKFQIRYYGRSYNNLLLDFLFYSRVLRGKHTNTFDHQLFDVKETESGNAFLFFENIKMNDNQIFGLPQPTGPQQPATKKYVDDNALLLSGGNMTGNIVMQGNRIYSLPIPTGSQQPATKEYTEKYFLQKIGNETTDYNADSKKLVNLADPINDTDAANKRYVLGQLGNVDLTAYLRRDGTQSMMGNLQMDKKYIEDLETPIDVPITDLVNYRKDAYRAVNKEYLRQNFLKKYGNGGGDYDLKQNVIRNAEPYRDGLFGDNDLVSKAFVDAEIAKLPKNVLKLDGSLPMRGNLKMGDHTITGIKSSSQDNAALTVGGAKSIYLPLNGSRGMESSLNMGNNTIQNLKMPPNDHSSGNPPDDCALNFKYFHSQRGDLERQINEVGSKAFSKDGSDPIEGKLDMNLFDIINLPTAASNESSYAANVNYVNKTVSDNNAIISSLIDSKVAEVEALNIKASKRENEFSFVMDDDLFKEDDDDITKVGKVDKDFYDINQATYEFTINYDSKIGYYSTRLTIDLKALDIGEFTLVFEMYYDSSKINKDEVVVNALSGSLNVSRHNTNKFSDHSRTIINFHKYGFLGLNDLDIDITLKNKSGISYDPTATIFVVAYGVSGHQNDVDTRIWDRIYYVDNQNVKFEAAIDMNNHDIINVDNLSMNNFINMNDNLIKNLQDGNEDGDAANIKQLNEFESNLVKFINRKITEVKNEIATAVKGVYFYTRNPAYNSYRVIFTQSNNKDN